MSDFIICKGEEVELKDIPSEIKILPMGHVHSQKGDFVVDDESFNLIQKKFKERALDIVIDYEHQTLSDVQAPAGGWIKELKKENDAIVAKVEWTKKAEEYLKNKEYRYLSPVVLTRISDKKAVILHSVALTNTPAIDGMFPIINAAKIEDIIKDLQNKEDNKMELEKLIEFLGLAPDATEEDVNKALEELKKTAEDKKKAEEKKAETELVANKTVLDLLELPENAKTEEVTAKIMSFKNGSTEILTEVLALKEKLKEDEAGKLVELALKDGKISSAQLEWAKAYALKDGEGFKKFVEMAPRTVPIGKVNYDADKGDPDLNLEVLKALGVSKEDALKYGI